MILYLVAGAVAILFLSRQSGGTVPPPAGSAGAGIANGQTYAQDPSVAASAGSPFSTAGTPLGAPPAVPGNIPVLPAGAPPPIAQSVSIQASATFSGSTTPTLETRSGLGHFVNTTPTVLDRTGRGAF